MAYKKLIKVSNICQVLDKSKYPATRTDRGITFTNNGDGTITVNGTPTGSYYSLYTISIKLDVMIPGHKYATLGIVDHLACMNIGNYTGGHFFKNSNNIYTLPEHEYTRFVYEIRANIGYTYSNVLVKPQLFDLTEMYGAGHEPTTVEQFRQDFPEEMYDYKPYCWLTSYKRVIITGDGNYLTAYRRNLTCKTKNLLPYPYYETTITRHGVTFTDNRDGTITANGTSTGFATFVFSKNYNFIAGNTYYVSIPYSIIAYKENGTIYYTQGNKSFTWSSNWEVVQIYVQINKGITLNNLKIYPMINLGDTATDYVPYGHL